MAQHSKPNRAQTASDPGSDESRLRFADGSIARRAFPENPELVAALERIKALEERVGDNASLINSSEAVIPDVLRKAGETRSAEMSRALAPLVVSSMREEIKNSSDDMVTALYPIMGRLVSSYVRGAFVELTEKINKALEESFSLKRWKIRLKARMTGKSEAEILLSEARPFAIDDLFVIHRKSGLLIARAEDASPGAPDADLVGAMLTAIMSFVEDAFQEDMDSTLRAISFGASRLLIRTTPTLVVAAKITGVQPIEFERAFGDEVLDFADQWGQELINFDGGAPLPDQARLIETLRAMSDKLPVPDYSEQTESAVIEPEETATDKSSLKRYAPFAIAGAAAIALLFWWTEESAQELALREITEKLAADETLRRFPLKVLIEDDQILVRGWVPDKVQFERLNETLNSNEGGSPLTLDVFFPGGSAKVSE